VTRLKNIGPVLATKAAKTWPRRGQDVDLEPLYTSRPFDWSMIYKEPVPVLPISQRTIGPYRQGDVSTGSVLCLAARADPPSPSLPSPSRPPPPPRGGGGGGEGGDKQKP